MESNKELRYVDTNPAPRVSKSTLTKMIWRSTMLQASFNYERMQSGGWLWAMLPGLEEVHTNLILRQNHLAFGELQRYKNALEDIQLLMSHRAISSCQLSSYVTNRNVKVFH